MSFNIVDLVKDQISDQILGQMGGLLGDQSSKAEAGVANAIPALLSGITNRAGVPGGADSLFGAVQNQDDGLLDNLGAMLGGSQSRSMIDQGSSVLGSLLGNSGLGSLAGVLSGLTGLSKGNTGSLMGMLAPIIFSVLKRKVLGGGLNAGGLLDMLKGQNNNINAAMPVGLSDQLNSSGFLSSITNVGGSAVDAASGAVGNVVGGARDAAGNVVGGARDAAGNVVDGVGNIAGGAANTVRDGVGAGAGAVGNAAANTASGGSSIFKKLIPLIAIALLGFLGWKMFGGTAKDAVDDAANATGNAATAVTDTASNAASATTEAASDAVATATESATNAASSAADAVAGAVDFDVSQAGNDLTSMFGDAKSSLEGITDLDSAKSAVPGLTEMGEKFNGIADKMPEGASGALSPIISKGLEILEPVLEKVRAIPGVGALIDPILGPMIEKMQDMAG